MRRRRPPRHRDLARRRRTDVLVGILGTLIVASATWLVFGGPRPKLSSPYEVQVTLANAAELRQRSPVRIAGVEVGRVGSIERGPGSTALVTLELRDSARPIHTDATVKVRPRLFLEGNFFLDMKPGSPSAPELEDGGTLPLSQTATAVQLDQVLTALSSDTRDDLQTLVDELGRGLGDTGGGHLRRTLGEAGPAFLVTAQASSALRGLDAHDLSRTITNAARVMGALDARRVQLAGTIRGLDRTAGAVAAEQRALGATLRELPPLLREALPAVRDVRAALPATRAFTRDVRPLLRRAPQTLDLARPLLRELRPLLAPGALPALTRALRPPVRTLAALQPGLEELLGRVTPVTDCVRDRALPVLRTPVKDGEHTTGQPPWQELLHAMVGLASGSQNFDGNGTAVRYMAGFGEQLVSTGRLPGLGRLQALAQAPVEGARPAPPAGKPPFVPTAECRRQQLVSLDAQTAAAPPGQEAPAPTAALTALVDDALRELRESLPAPGGAR
jgi:virulence factor Mce-like protein